MVVAAIVFGIVALAELADTSALATLVLGARFPARLVLLGVFAAFVLHVGLALLAGSFLALLPERPLEIVLAVIFLVGAVLVLRGDDDDDDLDLDAPPRTRWRVVATAFGVTLLSELGDPTQIIVATLAARYDDPVAVGIGALLALWAVSVVAVYGGNRLARVVAVRWLNRIVAAILVLLAVISAIAAFQA